MSRSLLWGTTAEVFQLPSLLTEHDPQLRIQQLEYLLYILNYTIYT